MKSQRVERRLAAGFAADMVGYSRLMEFDETDTITRQSKHRKELIDPKIAEYGGRIVKLMGDGMLVEFGSIVDSVLCAVEIQKAMVDREAEMPSDRRISYRIGINLGDIVIDGDDILGDGVNVAARLEGLAEPGGICVSEIVQQSVAGKVDFAFEDKGDQQVKNIARAIRAFSVAINIDQAATPLDPTIPLASPQSPPSEKPSIAVLAFDNMSGDKDQEYFSDGISEDIITGLSRIKGLLVISRNSSFTYKGQQVDIKRVGEELGVRYVLEGSVRRGGDKIRVTGQLIDAKTGGHVWADRYDGKLDDIFELQDDITAKVLGAVGTEITLAEIERSRRERPGSVDAWDRYLQALPFYYQTDLAGHEKVKVLLSQAMEIDPGFSSAYALLALNYSQAAFHAWEASATYAISQSEELARKSISLDLKDPLGHVALGWVHLLKSKPEQAVKALNRGLEFDPSYPTAYGLLSSALVFLGRTEEALIAFEKANSGSPNDPLRFVWYLGVMNAQFADENYLKCVEAGERAILLKPNFYGAYFISAAALSYLGRGEEAKEAVEIACKFNPKLSLTSVARNPMYVRSADIDRLLEGLRQAGLRE
jgi:adenylate cyclase